jgi:uncharacterized OB-fold protein
MAGTAQPDELAELSGPYVIEAPFWQGVREGELRLPRCAGCQRWNWPPVPRCPWCGSFEHVWERVEPRGTIYSWTRIHRASRPALADDVPYVVALVELPQAGSARVLGRLSGDERGLALGVPVTGSFRPPSAMTNGMPSIVWTLDVEGAPR